MRSEPSIPPCLQYPYAASCPRREKPDNHFGSWLRETRRVILPNTAGGYTAGEAVSTACMARQLLETNFIKLDVIGDEVNLQPEPFQSVEAAGELVRLGFQVLPYCADDSVSCRRWMLAARCGCPWQLYPQPPRSPQTLCIA